MHYGVPGMKWGVRKARRKLNKASRLKEKASKERVCQKELKRYGLYHPDVIDEANRKKKKLDIKFDTQIEWIELNTKNIFIRT